MRRHAVQPSENVGTTENWAAPGDSADESAMISDPTWSELETFLDDRQLIELPYVIGTYAKEVFLQDPFRLRLVRGNPGLQPAEIVAPHCCGATKSLGGDAERQRVLFGAVVDHPAHIAAQRLDPVVRHAGRH